MPGLEAWGGWCLLKVRFHAFHQVPDVRFQLRRHHRNRLGCPDMTIAISRSQSAFRRQESHLRKSRPRPPRLHPGSGGLGRPVSAERPRGLLKSSFDTVPTVRFHIQRHRRTRTGKPHTNTCPAGTLSGVSKSTRTETIDSSSTPISTPGPAAWVR